MMASDQRNRNRAAGASTGLILIGVGVVLLLDHMHILRGDDILRFWPLILVVAGIVRLRQEHHRAFGVLFIAFGTLLLFANLGIGHLSWNLIWPIGLICIGIAIVYDRFFSTRTETPTGQGREYLNEIAIFGGVERRLTVSDFKGGTISAIFGGVEIDLRSADMAENETIVDVEALFGGVELIVPTSWTVAFQGQSIFGGYSDETISPAPDALRSTPNKTLILRGRAMFGGVSVKN